MIFAALLRGVNVSGKNRIGMAELKSGCESLGLRAVRTYLQSGNVVFAADRKDPRFLAAGIKDHIAEDFRLKIEVLVLPDRIIDQIADSNPLFPRLGSDETRFHATFPFQPVPESEFKTITLPAGPGEQAVWGGPAIYLHCPNGYGRTRLNNTFFEKALRVPATTRNWRTVIALRKLCSEGE
jgi:uncharacterized protein (DUF1697 family)